MGMGSHGLGQTSTFAVRCGNCRVEYDVRSFKNNMGDSCCPNCGYLYSHQQLMAQQQQMQMGMQQNQWNSLSNQLNGGISAQGLAGLGAHMQQLQQAQFKPNVVDDRSPELVEYEKRVKAIKVELPAIAKETKMFGLWKQRTELRIEIKKLVEDLEHHKKNEEMRIAEAVQKQRLASNDEVSKVKIECDRKIAEAKNTYETNLTTLQGKFTRDKAEMQAAHAKDLAEARAKAAEEYYEKMTKALTELHQNGDKNSRFVQELALNLMKKSPKVIPGSVSIRAKGKIKELEKLTDK